MTGYVYEDQATDFGQYLRRARELCGLTRDEISRTTKIPAASLERLEAGRLRELPATVFVEGFVRAYARAVRLPVDEAISRLRACAAPTHAIVVEERPDDPSAVPASVAPAAVAHEMLARRRVGVALMVFLVLVTATVTLSLLLRGASTPIQPMS